MKLKELKKEIAKYQYFEDTNIIDITLASVVATRLKLGDPVWLVIIGPSSGGKSQILRPISLTDKKFLHRIDDLTENTLLSGGRVAGGGDVSLLTRIGSQGMLVLSDLTVLFSKPMESQAAILSQLRMVYDGEMTKFVGTSDKPITWKGYLGIVAGSTPSLYANFEEVADMGERFIYYRMKDYDPEKAVRLAMGRNTNSKDIDSTLGELYGEYIKDVVKDWSNEEIIIPEPIKERIMQISMFAEKIRTPMHLDFRSRDVDRIPVSAMPMRVALQLLTLVKALIIMKKNDGEEFGEIEMKAIEWCGYSLANEEKRAVLEVLSHIEYGLSLSTQSIADRIGLSTPVTRSILQNMAAVGVLKRNGLGDALTWSITDNHDWGIVRRIVGIDSTIEVKERSISNEETEEMDAIAEQQFGAI